MPQPPDPNQNIEQLDDLIMRFKDCAKHEGKDHLPFGDRCITKWQFKSAILALISKQVSEAEKNKLEWAWAIIANAGKIWDEDTKEAKEWREVAWKLEKDFHDHIKQTPPTPNGDEQGGLANPSTPTALSKQADNLSAESARKEQ